MNIKRIFRGVLTTVSLLIIVTMTMLLCVVGCDNKDYSNASPFDTDIDILTCGTCQQSGNLLFPRLYGTVECEIGYIFQLGGIQIYYVIKR